MSALIKEGTKVINAGTVDDVRNWLQAFNDVDDNAVLVFNKGDDHYYGQIIGYTCGDIPVLEFQIYNGEDV